MSARTVGRRHDGLPFSDISTGRSAESLGKRPRRTPGRREAKATELEGQAEADATGRRFAGSPVSSGSGRPATSEAGPVVARALSRYPRASSPEVRPPPGAVPRGRSVSCLAMTDQAAVGSPPPGLPRPTRLIEHSITARRTLLSHGESPSLGIQFEESPALTRYDDRRTVVTRSPVRISFRGGPMHPVHRSVLLHPAFENATAVHAAGGRPRPTARPRVSVVPRPPALGPSRRSASRDPKGDCE